MAGTTADTRFFEERQKQPKRGLCIDCENNSNLKECNPYNMKMVSCPDYSSGNEKNEIENARAQKECLEKIMKLSDENRKKFEEDRNGVSERQEILDYL